MKKKKKLALVLTSMVAILALATGCGNKKDTEAKSEDGITKITWYMAGDESKDHQMVMDEANDYLREKIKAEIDIKMIGFGDYEKKMQIIMSSGEPYDIAFVTNYVSNANKGAYLDLTDYLDTTLKGAADGLADGYIKGASIDGKLMAFPINGAIASAEYWVMPEDFVNEYDLDIENVQKVQDLEPVLKKFHEQEPAITPFAINGGYRLKVNFDQILGSALPFGIPLEGETDKIVNVYESPEMIKNLETMHDYYKAGYIMKDAATAVDDPFALKKDNKNWLVRQQTSGYDGTSGIEALTGFPVVSKRLTDKGIKTTSSATVALQAVSANSKHPEKAMEVINLVNTDEKFANILANGIESVHYEDNEDGSITFLDRKADYTMGGWEFTDFNLQKIPELLTPEQEEERATFIDESIESPALGFAVDTKPIRTELASIQSVMDQYLPSLHTGTVEPKEKLKAMNEKLEKAGLQKAIDEIQKQYTDWQKEVK
ncbi:ABC transporter substrate-binding protein [Carnobacterium sp.]|uniref:ABC transporter substrate-binding protein n=1 Tax=Carnobacterium sp. TaxID=48221 RepID=UPI0028A69849|nr:ABC transporter substrate-binding protein [Carnobacterium sp.]